MSETEPTLFVVDDELSARKGVAALAASIDIACETFASAEDFLEQCDFSRPGCVLTDLRLEGMSGLDLQEKLVAAESALTVILISAYADVPTTVRAMRNGALTVLEKPYGEDQLADAIRAAFEMNRNAREELARRADILRRVETLSFRERHLIRAVLAGRPNRLIAQDFQISQRTVDRIRASVFEKMGVESAVELVQRVGILDVFDDEEAAPPPS